MAKDDLAQLEGEISDVGAGGQYKVMLENKVEISASGKPFSLVYRSTAPSGVMRNKSLPVVPIHIAPRRSLIIALMPSRSVP